MSPRDANGEEHAAGYLRASPGESVAPDRLDGAPGAVELADVLHASAICRERTLRTPIELAEVLSEQLGFELHLKLECFQRTGSFKLRGAVSALADLESGDFVVTASAGNHGLGVATAAAELGLRARIFVPETVDSGKLRRLRAIGGPVEVVPVAGTYDDTERAAREAVASTPRARFVSSYNDTRVVAGQGTVALELLEQLPRLDAVVVPVGGGGLISGVGVVMKAAAPSVKVIGAEPASSPAMARSLNAGELVRIDEHCESIAEGLVGNLDPDSITVPLAAAHVDEIVLVSEARIRSATAALYALESIVGEPSAAAALAAIPLARSLPKDARVACVITGRNIAADVHRRLLDEESRLGDL